MPLSILISSGHLLRRLTASEPLENGTALVQGSAFTYQDVLAGLIGYLPGNHEVAVDEFQFSLTDGYHVDTGRMEIHIELPTSDSSLLVINRGLQLSAGKHRNRVVMVLLPSFPLWPVGGPSSHSIVSMGSSTDWPILVNA